VTEFFVEVAVDLFLGSWVKKFRKFVSKLLKLLCMCHIVDINFWSVSPSVGVINYVISVSDAHY
jgi:hypothetical protein